MWKGKFSFEDGGLHITMNVTKISFKFVKESMHSQIGNLKTEICKINMQSYLKTQTCKRTQVYISHF